MSVLEDVRLRELGKQAEKAAEMQRVAEAARISGANQAVQGLAALAAENAYGATVSPQVPQGVPTGAVAGSRGFMTPATNGQFTDATAEYMNQIRARKAVDGLAARGLQ